MNFPLNTGGYECVICATNASEINLKKKLQQLSRWSTATCGSLLPLDQNFQYFLSLHSIPEYPIINAKNGVNRKAIKIINHFLIRHLKTFIPWDLWAQGGAGLLLVQVFPDGQQQIHHANFSRHSEIKLNINSLST